MFSYVIIIQKMYEKYSKSLGDIANIKRSFIEENDSMLNNMLKINANYTEQIARKVCKVCENSIKDNCVDISKHGVDYQICDECGHLNGTKLDTNNFCDALYKESGGSNYSKNYKSKYKLRVKKIYKPKADYLLEILNRKLNIKSFSVDDFGCGAGHFVHALGELGVSAKGFDISEDLIKIARAAWEDSQYIDSSAPFFIVKEESELIQEIIKSNADVISLHGVLEHLRFPNKVFDAFLLSNSKYMYFSVPLFSLSVYLENVFPQIFPRQLSGGHTHLYTHQSINYICNKYNLKEISKWIFGTDSMDLKRSLLVQGVKNGMSDKAKKFLNETLFTGKVMDEIQEVLDKNHSASQIHIIVSKE